MHQCSDIALEKNGVTSSEMRKDDVNKPLNSVKKEKFYDSKEDLALDTNIAEDTGSSFYYCGSLYHQVHVKEEKVDDCDEDVQFQYGFSDKQVVYEAGSTDIFKREDGKITQFTKEEFIDESGEKAKVEQRDADSIEEIHDLDILPEEANKTNACGKNLERKYKCQICSKSFMWKIHFKAHVLRHRNEVGNKHFSLLRQTENMSHQPNKPLVTSDGKFNCQFCAKVFLSIGPLNVHTRTHTGERPHACQICGIRFAQKVSMQKHIMSKHIVEPQFKCKMCGKAFKGKYSLTLHEQLHTTLPLACEVCGKAFGHKSALKKHMTYMHSKPQTCAEPSLKCHVCFKKFSSKSNVMKHERKHAKADNMEER